MYVAAAPSPASRRVPGWLYHALVLGAFLSYSESGMGPVKAAAYGLSLVAVLGMLVTAPPHPKDRISLVAFICIGMAATTTLSLFSSGQASLVRLLQELTYPLILGILLLCGYGVHRISRRRLERLLIVLWAANVTTALLGSLGIVSSLPLFGEVGTGRYIFGTSIPSSDGLSFNVNYYATSQAVLMLLHGWLRSGRSERFSQRDWGLLGLMFASVLIGSSRGITLALLAAGAALGIIVSYAAGRIRTRVRAAAVLLLLAIGGVAAAALYTDQLYYAFRLDRGLNERDVIWAVGVDLWLQKPIFGWGPDMGRMMGVASGGDLEGRSLHSGYLHTLVRGGLSLAVFSYGSVLLSLFWGLGRRRDLWVRHRWAVGIIVFYLVASVTRTYSIGGLGLLPVAAALAMSTCLHARRSGAMDPYLAAGRARYRANDTRLLHSLVS